MDRRSAFDEHADIGKPAQQNQCSKHRRPNGQRIDEVNVPEFAFEADFFFVASDFEFNPEPDDRRIATTMAATATGGFARLCEATPMVKSVRPKQRSRS
jgi:hypothetical protein